MGGELKRLAPGRYRLEVREGDGPAGVHRGKESSIRIGVEGGTLPFQVSEAERVYYWWRGPDRPAGVKLTAAAGRPRKPVRRYRGAAASPAAMRSSTRN